MLTILDLNCGAGGAGMGYFQACQDAGVPCRIIGVDNQPQPDYPFEFVQGDSILFAWKYAGSFDFIHASPPCQAFTRSTKMWRLAGKTYPNLVPATRRLMEITGKPGVIENVPGSPIRPDIVLRGDAFGLKVQRRRWFELVHWWTPAPMMPQLRGSVKEGDYVSVFGKGAYRKSKHDKHPKFDQGSVLQTWRFAMGIDWMKRESSIAEAIPPAYTRWIFSQFLSMYHATKTVP